MPASALRHRFWRCQQHASAILPLVPKALPFPRRIASGAVRTGLELELIIRTLVRAGVACVLPLRSIVRRPAARKAYGKQEKDRPCKVLIEHS
jgi:hypothetical protein